jgi:thioesterase domain-containing protein
VVGELKQSRILLSTNGSSKTGMRPAEEHNEDRLRAEIASQLSELWARALERPKVDEHSDFYFDGGNHFLAPVMIECINNEMGLQLTVRDLEQARTIAKLTDLIYFEQTRIDRSTVVPLRNAHGSRPPLFIVHGVGGNVLGFYSLAKCLHPDQPVYGIQAQSLLPDQEALLKLDEMAERYIADMRAVSPEGPYNLLGFSFGGLVAYEIAQQLHAAGSKVGLLGMLDTRQPDSMRGATAKGPIHERVYWRLKLAYLRTYRRKGRLRYLWRRLGERMQRFRYMYAASRGPGKLAMAVRNVREINYVAGVSYTVQPYPGKLTLFRAENDPLEAPQPYDFNWSEFALGGMEIKDLPGDHGRILYQPGLNALAAELTTALKDAGSAERASGSPPPERLGDALQGANPDDGRISMEI